MTGAAATGVSAYRSTIPHVINFGARMYDPLTGSWLTPDPLAHKYTSWSTYAYCAGNPVNFVDPDGRNPIYNAAGVFIGTDDKGLRGKAIFMDESSFWQNMPNKKALLNDNGTSYLENNESQIRFEAHYNSLSNRPDWDGRITLFEANKWYRTGNGEALFADINQIDLSSLKIIENPSIEHRIVTNTLFSSIKDGVVYGNITLNYMPTHSVRAFSDNYGFEMKLPWEENVLRNLETIIGKIIAGQGTAFDIHIYGTKYLNF